jgi:transposase
MIPHGTRIWIVAGCTDLRRGFLGLSAMVQTALEENPFSGQVFVFRGKRGDLIKLLWFDGDGLCLFAKRLERGRFMWPQATTGSVALTRAQLSMLLEGIDWRRPQRTAPPQMAVEDTFAQLFVQVSLLIARLGGILSRLLAATLPDLHALDREALHALLIAEHTERLATQDALVATQQRLSSRENEIEHLKLLLAKLRRMQFGRRSEKVERQIEQLELRLEELQTKQAAELSHTPRPQSVDAPSAKSTRQPLPAHLPREVRRHLPQEQACPDCGSTLRHLGEDVSEMLEYVPARFQVIRHVRPKLSCDACDRIVQAPAPSRPIERGLAGPGLLAHVLIAKYSDHLPLYRQSEFTRAKVWNWSARH